MASYYQRSQLTSSNGHVTGIDSPMRDSPPVANPNRHDAWIQEMVDGGIEAIERAEKRIKNIKIECCSDIDARIIGFSCCKEARERLAAKEAQSQSSSD